MKRLTESSVDKKYMAKAILENIDLLEETALQEAYCKNILPKILKEEFNISFFFQSGYLFVYGIDLKVDAYSTVEDAIKQVDAFLSTNNKDEVALKNRYAGNTAENVFIKEPGRGVYVCNDRYGMSNMDSFFDLLLWAVTDQITKDRGKVLEILDRLKVDLGYMKQVPQAFNEYIPEVECTVIKQKNGIVKLKGTDQEVIDRMDYVIRLCNKYQRS